jgi:hypothetical protein
MVQMNGDHGQREWLVGIGEGIGDIILEFYKRECLMSLLVLECRDHMVRWECIDHFIMDVVWFLRKVFRTIECS